MSSLSIENLGQAVQMGDPSRMLGSSQARVTTEMAKEGLSAGEGDVAAGNRTFGDVLKNSMEKVNEYQSQADTAIKELVAGRSKNIHETMLAVERADASLKLMMQVRNKVLDAYREIMRMQV